MYKLLLSLKIENSLKILWYCRGRKFIKNLMIVSGHMQIFTGHYSSLDMIIRVYSSSMLIGKQIFGIIYTSKKIKT